jgi:hypothetical protein
MKSFKLFLKEASLERKITDGTGHKKIDIPGADVVHHDPEEGLTVYHLKTPGACYAFGSGTPWCTNTKHREHAHDYLKHGNLFGYHYKNKRAQLWEPNPDLTNTSPEFKNEQGKDLSPSAHRTLKAKANFVTDKIPHHPFNDDYVPPPHPYESKTDHELVTHIKSLANQERMDHYKSIIGNNTRISPDDYGRDPYEIVQQRFDKRDLHRFADDKDHGHFIASHAPLDTVYHKMKDHPDSNVRDIIRQRARIAGGHILGPTDHPSTFENHPDQLPLKFPKVKINQRAKAR